MLSKDCACRFCAVHYDYGNRAKLDLIDGPVLARPLSIYFSRIDSEVRNIPNERKTSGSLIGWYSSVVSCSLVGEQVQHRKEYEGYRHRA